MWDWSVITDRGKRNGNFIASHLLKAVHFWTDSGLGSDLFYLRDKDKREVDFLVTRNKKLWFLVEVKSSAESKISESLSYFQQTLDVPHAFQVVMDLDFIDRDCFKYKKPVIVPASTFLSQLV